MQPDDATASRTDPYFLAVARGDAAADLVLTGGRVLNVFRRAFEHASVAVYRGRIAAVVAAEHPQPDARERLDCSGLAIAPGFIDAHMHVESTMLPPTRFARLALPHGTTAAVFDPHEIANVLGEAGIRWIVDDAERAPFDARFGLSSCVPSAPLETAGAELDADALERLFDDPRLARRVVALAEMMNFPGVVNAAPGVLAKVALGLARSLVDGHAPGLSGRALQTYVAAGVSSDHECTTADEASEKLALGMRIFIREGSAAKNLDALASLVTEADAHRFCFCTDDRHPSDLRDEGHIDHVVRKAIRAGVRPETALCIGSHHTAEHYRLTDMGAVAPGMLANFVLLDDVDSVRVMKTFHRGVVVAEAGEPCFETPDLAPWPEAPVRLPTGFGPASLRIAHAGADTPTIRVIGMHPDQLVTDSLQLEATVRDGALVADPQRDILKLAVVERHRGAGNVGLGFVKNFRFQGGAIASTVGHDAHNLAIVGDDDDDMTIAAEALAHAGGGQCVVAQGELVALLPLPIAGLMSDQPPEHVIRLQAELLHAAAERLGCPHHDPFMPLSFLPLPVIPSLKLTDLGLVDVARFEPTSLVVG